MAALISSTPRAFASAKSSSLAASSISKPQSQTLTFPKSFTGLRLPSPSRSISLSRGSHSAKSFAVKASCHSVIEKDEFKSQQVLDDVTLS